MLVAWGRVHRGKPIWASSGGAELPLINMAVALAFTLAGPGRFSLDRLFGVRIPTAVAALFAAAVAGGSLMALSQARSEPSQPQAEEAPVAEPSAAT
jgi:putative oxidoreductase